MQTRASFLNRRYFDDKHFPYGFSRSGDFTFEEVKELESKGVLFRALSAGLVEDVDESDQHFLSVMAGKTPATTLAEKAWLKYLQRCNRAPVWLTTRRLADEADIEFEVDEDEVSDDFDEAVEA
ncbi:MAG: DUF413 domain-containing protein [Gammaproteobacteria bacterium]|nr:DUF413 domain-containing protein [Gammaproteobacteria bacterium]